MELRRAGIAFETRLDLFIAHFTERAIRQADRAAVVLVAIDALIEHTEFEAATRYTGDIHADLLRVLQAYQAAVILHERFFFVVFAELSRTPELAGAFSQPFGLFQSIGALLARYQSAGVLKPENPLHSTACLLGPLIYFSMIARSAADASMPPMEIEPLLQHFLDGRCASKPAS